MVISSRRTKKFLPALQHHIYIYKVVIYVSLFGCLIITQKPSDRLASNFHWGTRENVGHGGGYYGVPWATLGFQASLL